MKKIKDNFVYFTSIVLGNGIVLMLSAVLFPTSIVFGNANVPSLISVMINALLLSSVLVIVPIITKSLKITAKFPLKINIIYGLTNIFLIWLLSKMANYLGFGIASFMIAVLLGTILTLIQYLLWLNIGKKK